MRWGDAVEIVAELAGHAPAVRSVVSEAFGEHGAEVTALVEALREAASARGAIGPGGPWYVGFLAVEDGRVIGHVGASRMLLVHSDRSVEEVCCLAPLAVVPDRQRRGVGRALVAALVEWADRVDMPAVVLEGDPAVYSRYGFVPAFDVGWGRVSPLIPAPAQQVYPLRGQLRPGRLMYPEPVWWAGGAGLPVDPWLDELSRQAGTLAALALDADADIPFPGEVPFGARASMPGVPGWTPDGLLEHLGSIYRLVTAWLRDGARPATVPVREGVDAWHAMVDAWHDLHDELARRPVDAATSTWCAYDTTVGFWRRRMLHETAIHAFDVASASGVRWRVPDAVARDGVEEALRLWLGTMLGSAVGGTGQRVTIAPEGGDEWTVALHGGVVEVHRLGGTTHARVGGDAASVYRWLWGRADDAEVRLDGDLGAVAALRACLARAMQ